MWTVSERKIYTTAYKIVKISTLFTLIEAVSSTPEKFLDWKTTEFSSSNNWYLLACYVAENDNNLKQSPAGWRYLLVFVWKTVNELQQDDEFEREVFSWVTSGFCGIREIINNTLKPFHHINYTISWYLEMPRSLIFETFRQTRFWTFQFKTGEIWNGFQN